MKVGAEVFGILRRGAKSARQRGLGEKVLLTIVLLQLRESTYSGCHCEGVNLIREWRTVLC